MHLHIRVKDVVVHNFIFYTIVERRWYLIVMRPIRSDILQVKQVWFSHNEFMQDKSVLETCR